MKSMPLLIKSLPNYKINLRPFIEKLLIFGAFFCFFKLYSALKKYYISETLSNVNVTTREFIVMKIKGFVTQW